MFLHLNTFSDRKLSQQSDYILFRDVTKFKFEFDNVRTLNVINGFEI